MKGNRAGEGADNPVAVLPDGLEAWQSRMGLSGAEAARRLGIPYRTYLGYLPSGRRRRGGLPGWLPVLCGYIEREAACAATGCPVAAQGSQRE